MTVTWEAAGGTDVGRRRRGNEDAFRMDPSRGFFLVADGMGGHAAGEIASALAADTVTALLTRALEHGLQTAQYSTEFHAAVQEAHQRLVNHSANDVRTRGMGTTLTACLLDPDGGCEIVHIGDSRLYRWRAGLLEQLTHDHTWVQREIDAGRISAAEALDHPHSHILTRVLTDDEDAPQPDLVREGVQPGDLLLLATDGLYNMLDEERISALVSLDLSLPQRVEALIEAANLAGGTDNITVVLVRILPGSTP